MIGLYLTMDSNLYYDEMTLDCRRPVTLPPYS